MSKTCKILLIDEVNAKVTEIDPITIRKCIKALKFFIPQAKHSPAFKLGRWDGTVSFFTAGGITQINMLDKIIPILEQDGYDIELVDNRKIYNFQLPLIDENVVSDYNWPSSHPTKPNQPIVLGEHQVEIINNFLNNTKGIQIVPTSGGKTICTAVLSKLVEKFGRTIVIVPNKQLVNQTLEDYELLKLDVGVYFGDRKDWGKTHTICTWQSLDKLYKETKKDIGDKTISEMSKDVIAVIVDEAHVSKAEVLKFILTKIFHHSPIRWGLTGTMSKQEFESISITGSIGPVINTIKATDLQDKGVLSHCEINIIQIEDQSKFNSYTDEHHYLVNDEKRIDMLSKFIENINETGNTLVLVQNIPTGKKMAKIIKNSVFISGAVKVADRKEEYDEIATSTNKVIIATYGVASTGINVPRIFNLILLEPGRSFVRTIQSIGRGLRRATDKDRVIIYDMCATTKYSKRHLTERKKFYKEMGYPFQIIKINPNEF